MVLVDTSIWIDHFRGRLDLLERLLEQGDVLTHPMVIGELACGGLPSRRDTLYYLRKLNEANLATDAEVIHLLNEHRLHGRGIGWVDAHLVASALLSHCRLWTRDARLQEIAGQLGVLPVHPEPGAERARTGGVQAGNA